MTNTKSTETITYSFIEDCTSESGEWTGDKAEAVRAGVEAVDAEPHGDDYIYRATETRLDYIVDEDELAQLGAALLDGVPMAAVYSIWCSETGSQYEGPEGGWSPGDEVEGGDDIEAYDCGQIVEVRRGEALVRWASNVSVWVPVKGLRPSGAQPYTDTAVESLRDRAGEAGDEAMVIECERYLAFDGDAGCDAGWESARAAVSKALRYGYAQA